MRHPSRRDFVKAGGAISVATIAARPSLVRAQRAEFTLKFGNVFQSEHPVNVRAKEAADAIRRDSGGKVDLQVFPNGQLGSSVDMLSQVRSGALDFYVGGLILSSLVPSVVITAVGFAFKDYDQVWSTMDGDLGKYIRTQVSKVGLVPMEKTWDNGFRNITTSTKPIVLPSDIRGLKIRIPSSPLWVSLFKGLGALPTIVDFNELYSALQTKIADGQENPLALIEQARLYEVQKYCSMTNHIWDGAIFLANAKVWGRLPSGLQEIAAKHLDAAGMATRTDVAALNASLEKTLKDRGMVFNQPDIQPFREALREAGFYAEWRKRFGEEAWSLLEKHVGKLP